MHKKYIYIYIFSSNIINVCFCLSNYLDVEETWNCRLELLFYQRKRERERDEIVEIKHVHVKYGLRERVLSLYLFKKNFPAQFYLLPC